MAEKNTSHGGRKRRKSGPFRVGGLFRGGRIKIRRGTSRRHGRRSSGGRF